MIQEISSEHILSPAALNLLENKNWPGNLRQLRKVHRQAITNSKNKVIRGEIREVLGFEDSDEIATCPSCSNSPVRSENCFMIQKTWRETNGNVSLVSRRLGI